MTSNEKDVLTQLVERDKYGLELVSGSEGRLKKNAIYVILGRMEDKGLIEGRSEPAPSGSQGPPRRRYMATDKGKVYLEDALNVEKLLNGEPLP